MNNKNNILDQDLFLSKLDNALAKTNWQVSAPQREQLIAFLALLHKWNKAYNLTSVRDPEEMLKVHILDSIAVAPFLDKQNYMDIGTGPGLPGIPLAIMHPEKNFVLLDSLGKRVRFMTQVKHELKLPNIDPVQSRVEDYHPAWQIDGVLSRAFASLKDMLHWCQHLVDSQGAFLALKGQYPEQEIADLPEGFRITNCDEIQVPGLNAERHIITLTKTH